MMKTKITKNEKKAKKVLKNKENKLKKEAKRNARALKIANFWKYKFLKTKKFLSVDRHRANVKVTFLSVIYSIILALFIAPVIIVVTPLELPLLAAGLLGLGLILLGLETFIPKLLKEILNRFKTRYHLAVQSADATKVYITKSAEKNVIYMSKKHSKFSKKGNRGAEKIRKIEVRDANKAKKKAEFQKTLNKVSNDFTVQIKTDLPKVDEVTINKI